MTTGPSDQGKTGGGQRDREREKCKEGCEEVTASGPLRCEFYPGGEEGHCQPEASGGTGAAP